MYPNTLALARRLSKPVISFDLEQPVLPASTAPSPISEPF
jgi:hypothetical protein